jgi:hypothetical protein
MSQIAQTGWLGGGWNGRLVVIDNPCANHSGQLCEKPGRFP